MRSARFALLSLLTLSFLAGCGTQVGTVWRHETVSSKAKAAARAAAQAKPTPAPSASTAAPTPTPTGVTFNLAASLRGQALAGYDVQVFDARNGQRFETGATVQAVDAKTGANGGFTLKVSAIPEGQALRVVASKSGFAVEAVLTAKTVASQGVTVDETSTALARVAAAPLATTRVLTSPSANAVVKRINELQLLRPAIAAKLAGTNSYANDLARPGETTAQARALRLTLREADLTKGVATFQAELIQEAARQAQTAENLSDLADDAEVVASLKDVELAGTVLRAAYDGDKATFTLTNSADTTKVDAATGSLETVLRTLWK